jgi:hypothetical protein
MVKKAILLLSAAACLATGVIAQVSPCGTDEMNQKLRAQHPEIAQYEAQMKADIEARINGMDLSKFKTTGENDPAFMDNDTIIVPLVYHVIHDYGGEYISDNTIFESVKEINRIYSRTQSDTATVIATFKNKIPGTNIKYIGKPNIKFVLATKDPQGNPTHGITRRLSYLTNLASDQSKLDYWPNSQYMNIWVINNFPTVAAGQTQPAAYAYKPPTAAFLPWGDGPISLYNYVNGVNYTLAHELGHELNLDHTWGGTNQPEVDCGDDDVDDTPPTMGHNTCGPTQLYDTRCTYKNQFVGKTSLNTNDDIVDNIAGVGISFKSLTKVNIDTVTFYPVLPNIPYQIVLKHNNTVMASYSGVTTNNKVDTSIGVMSPQTALFVSDQYTGLGIKFKVYDSVYLRNVTVYPEPLSVGLPFTIVLKKNGSIINTVTTVNTDTFGFGMTIPLNWAVQYTDTISEYSLEFSQNNGMRHDPYISLFDNRNLPGVIRITSDTANGNYNYFYNLQVTGFNYPERAVVHFLVPRDTNANAYKLEFAVNPGAKRDLGSAIVNSVPDGIVFTKDTTNGRYNYFYDWKIRTDYHKFYSKSVAYNLFGDSTRNYIDYPDTTNTQNVMDYSYCSKMFTYLQGVRMRATLRSPVAGRSNLVSPQNLLQTGATAPWPDLAPIADFSVNNVFTCTNAAGNNGPSFLFVNRSWNDTVSSVNWTFSNGSTVPTATTTGTAGNVPNVKFSTPGWVTITATANSNAGSNTVTKSNVVYIADDNVNNASGYMQEFSDTNENKRYPIFNYYNNFTKWEVVKNAGVWDNYSIRYKNLDTRSGASSFVGTPQGDKDDFFTPAFDMTQVPGNNLYLNFYTSGAFLTNNPLLMNDSLQIHYSTNCGSSWVRLKTLKKSEISNKGAINNMEYVPGGLWDWASQSIPMNNLKSSNKVFFRFRYYPSADPQNKMGIGNNFYLDRIHISPFTTDVATLEPKKAGIVLAPNPTTGSTFVMIKDANSNKAEVEVSDITGKIVYRTSANLNSNITSVEIPASYITVKGMYLVKVITGSVNQSEKLIVY